MFGASPELAPNRFGASSEPASVMEFGFYDGGRASPVGLNGHMQLAAGSQQQQWRRLFELNAEAGA